MEFEGRRRRTRVVVVVMVVVVVPCSDARQTSLWARGGLGVLGGAGIGLVVVTYRGFGGFSFLWRSEQLVRGSGKRLLFPRERKTVLVNVLTCSLAR